MAGRFDEVLKRAERFIQSCEPWEDAAVLGPTGEQTRRRPLEREAIAAAAASSSGSASEGARHQLNGSGSDTQTSSGLAAPAAYVPAHWEEVLGEPSRLLPQGAQAVAPSLAASSLCAGTFAEPRIPLNADVGRNVLPTEQWVGQSLLVREQLGRRDMDGSLPSKEQASRKFKEHATAADPAHSAAVNRRRGAAHAAGEWPFPERAFAGHIAPEKGLAVSSTAVPFTQVGSAASSCKGAAAVSRLDGSGLLSNLALANGQNHAEIAVLLDGLERENALLRKQLDRTFDRERVCRAEADRLRLELSEWKRGDEEIREASAAAAAAEIETLRDSLRRKTHLVDELQHQVEALREERDVREASATDLAERLAIADAERLQAAQDAEASKNSLRIREAEVRELQLMSKYFSSHKQRPTSEELNAAELAEELRQRCARLTSQVDQLRNERDLFKAEYDMARLELRQSRLDGGSLKADRLLLGGAGIPLSSQGASKCLPSCHAQANGAAKDIGGAATTYNQRVLEQVRPLT